MPPFCRAKPDFGAPRSLQNAEPATNVARHCLYKIRVPNPFFWVHFCDFHNHWPLQNEEPCMSTHVSRIAAWNKESLKNTKVHFVEGWSQRTLVSPGNPEMHWTPFCRGKLLCHISIFFSSNHASFSTKWETCKINIMCILECWQTPKPLQNQEPTVSANYKMFPLQNQEPAFAYPCRHLGCPKKWFWRTPAGPDNGVDFFGGMFF